MVVVAGCEEGRLVTHALLHLEAEDVAVERDSAVEVGDLQVNMPDVHSGIELYRDRPREEWPLAPDGKGVAMVSEPLDLNALLAEADA